MKLPWLLAFGITLPLTLQAETTTIIQSKVREGVWTGWGEFGSLATESYPGVPQAPAKFTRVENSQTFSGTITGLRSTDGVEIGVVSLVGVHWTDPKNYQWQPINPDGSFSITSNSAPDANKTLVVRGPEIPWTFLQHDFRPNEGAQNVVIAVPKGKKVRLSVGTSETESLPEAHFQMFPILREYGNDGRPLRRQRIGELLTKNQSFGEVWLPLSPVGVLASCKGLASYYQIIDPRAADHFHFVLQSGGTLKVVVLDTQGNPKPNHLVSWKNPGAPYSLFIGKTNPEGIIERPHLTPGTFEVNADGFPRARTTVKNDDATELVLKAGTVIE